jgi:hypothetical protein
VCFAVGVMDPIQQGIIRGPSADVTPVVMRYRVFLHSCHSAAAIMTSSLAVVLTVIGRTALLVA